jgi:hypothetical protein
MYPDKEGGAMPTAVVPPEQFREEASRRLVDRFELQILLDIRSRSAIARMVEDGRIPRPVVSKRGASPLWDKDEVLASSDRKEG